MPRTYESEAYIVAIDDHWFLGKSDWTESPSYAMKYSKANKAAADAENERMRHPSARIRVAKLFCVFEVRELDEL